jgi:hypothetical protein
MYYDGEQLTVSLLDCQRCGEGDHTTEECHMYPDGVPSEVLEGNGSSKFTYASAKKHIVVPPTYSSSSAIKCPRCNEPGHLAVFCPSGFSNKSIAAHERVERKSRELKMAVWGKPARGSGDEDDYGAINVTLNDPQELSADELSDVDDSPNKVKEYKSRRKAKENGVTDSSKNRDSDTDNVRARKGERGTLPLPSIERYAVDGYCYNCGRKGHKGKFCTFPKLKRKLERDLHLSVDDNPDYIRDKLIDLKEQLESAKQQRACYRCGEPGHTAWKCTYGTAEHVDGVVNKKPASLLQYIEPKKIFNEEDEFLQIVPLANDSNMFCYRCREHGHRVSNCTAKKVHKSLGGSGNESADGGNRSNSRVDDRARGYYRDSDSVETVKMRERSNIYDVAKHSSSQQSWINKIDMGRAKSLRKESNSSSLKRLSPSSPSVAIETSTAIPLPSPAKLWLICTECGTRGHKTADCPSNKHDSLAYDDI